MMTWNAKSIIIYYFEYLMKQKLEDIGDKIIWLFLKVWILSEIRVIEEYEK